MALIDQMLWIVIVYFLLSFLKTNKRLHFQQSLFFFPPLVILLGYIKIYTLRDGKPGCP